MSGAGRGRTYVSGRTKIAGFVLTGALLAAFGAYELWPRAARERVAPAARAGTFTMGRALELPLTPVAATTRMDTPEAAPPAPAKATPAFLAPALPRVIPMGFWDDSNGQTAAKPVAAAAKPADSQDDPETTTPGRTGYSQLMQTTSFANTVPKRHHFHTHYTIKKNTKFLCLVDSPISFDLPGPVTCVTQENVWSMDGTNILLPTGTEVHGSIENSLGTGAERGFLVWTDVLTPKPDLLAIQIDAPAADEMGQIGVPGELNDHIWKKLKATALLTLIQTGGNVAQNLAQGNGNGGNNYFGNIGNSGQGLAEQALAHDLNIPTSLYRGPGRLLTVYVNKYIDLVSFYIDQPVRR